MIIFGSFLPSLLVGSAPPTLLGHRSRHCHGIISPTTGHGRPYNSLKHWGGRRELNPQPSEPQSDALPIELLPPQTLTVQNMIVQTTIVQTMIITTAAGLLLSLARLRSSHAHVLESHGAQARRVEQVLGVYDDRAFHQVADLGEIQRPELRPAGGDH